jgi:predicted O-linked N-acetylglucosamine transferase (SPINDLY family)
MTIQAALELAQAHQVAGRLPDAEALCRQILSSDSQNHQALHLLGLIGYRAGNYPAAVELMSQAIRLAPGVAEYRSHLGLALMRQGKLDEAISAYRHAILLQPDFAQVHNNLGNALTQKGLFELALASLGKTIQLWPDCAPAHTSLGNVYYHKNDMHQAIAAHRKAIALKPDYAEAHSNLANALAATGDADGAIASLRKAISLQPNFADAHCNLGNVLRDTGQVAEAIKCFEQASALSPFDGFDSNRVYCMHYHPGYDTPAICAELAKWNQKHAAPLAGLIQPYSNERNPDRRLRIGYVSSDFRQHVVGWNMLPLLSHHDRAQFEIFCYSSVAQPDAVTERLREHADVWRSWVGLDNQQAAEIVRRDQIDILVDLSLHTANNRLLLFARKPAPVQISYLGYCGSTGLPSIDYRFSDSSMDSPEFAAQYAEKTFYLPGTYWCYQPGGEAPPPGALPALSKGHITFGCLNNFSKVSEPCLQLWRRILTAIPNSKLILHAEPGQHRQRAANQLLDHGASSGRMEFVTRQFFAGYMQTYQRMDIALDPFPYGGGITSCDALWMGVPVVSLEGQTAVGRGGKSILTNIGATELLAGTTDQYEQIAIGLANDLPRLAGLRAGLRNRMKSSPLMDGTSFAKEVQAAYRQMWRQWCGSPARDLPTGQSQSKAPHLSAQQSRVSP